MQNKLRNVCLDPLILRKEKKEEIRWEGGTWTCIPLMLREHPAFLSH